MGAVKKQCMVELEWAGQVIRTFEAGYSDYDEDDYAMAQGIVAEYEHNRNNTGVKTMAASELGSHRRRMTIVQSGQLP